MRIGIEAQRIFRPKKHGMDIYALQLIRHLQELDKVNEYFIFVRSDADVCLANTANFTIVEVGGLTYADWEQVGLPLKIRDYDLDMLHCTSNTAPLYCKVPTLVTIHDIIYLNAAYSGGSFYQKLGHYYRKWVVPKVYQKAIKVMTVSNFEAKTIANYFGASDKLEVVYNGTNPLFYAKPNNQRISELRLKLGLPKDYILFLGNTAPKKNMTRAIEAYLKYSKEAEHPFPLVIVETDREVVNKILDELGRNAKDVDIHCIGYVANDMLPVVYQQAKLFLYPSLRESFGIPIIEAMASGTPVITSDTFAMPEVGGDAAAYINPQSADMLAKTMLQILSDEELLQAMISKGHKRANQFSWQNTTKQVIQIYQNTGAQLKIGA